jgi:hypothetical protein
VNADEKRTCEVEGCDRVEDGRCGMCKMHDTRRRRHGDPHTFVAHRDRALPRGAAHHAWAGDDVTYSAMHLRVVRERGPAKDQTCVDCGCAAAQWSYDRSCAEERTSSFGPYSTHVERYVPRCISCHKKFDLERIAS